MELNKKCIEILKYLKEKNDFVKLKDLAELYNTSDRAVRYNIDKIEEFLLKNGFKHLEREHLKGVKLKEDKGLFDFIDSFAGEYTPYKYVYSEDERFKFIITKLLQATEPLKLEYFEKKLCVSKNTILKDMKFIEKWIDDRNMKLIKKPRVGVVVEGIESNKRRAIIELASETISTEDLFSYMNRKIALSKINNLQFDVLFSEIDVDFLDHLIIESERELEREFSDETYGNLITHIAIMIKRIQLEKNTYVPEIGMEYLDKSKEYDIAKKITDKIQKKYNLIVPKEEISYIALHLLGAKVIKSNGEVEDTDFKNDGLYLVAKTMTDEIEKIYNVSLNDKKEKIIEGLVIHLRPTIYRIKFNLKLINPLFEEIKHNYGDLFLNTKYVIRYLENYINSSVNEHEVSYIALHFGAAIENSKEAERDKARVVLVCGTGVGTAKMLASQISREFYVEIVDTVSSRAVSKIKKEAADFIISTVDIQNLPKDSYIKINPLLLDKDYDALKKKLKVKYSRQKDYEIQTQKVNKLISIVEKYCTINDKQQLQYEFMFELLNNDKNPTRRCIYMLNDLIKADVVKINVECSNKVEAIKAGAQLLEAKGCIEKSYAEAILKNFEELGPYMVIAPGIVLSHARPECGVKKLSMSLITLKDSVKFGSELNDPVKLIITLAATDNETHLKALSQLMELFMNSKDLNSIMEASNKEEILEIIKKYSNML